jgi:hypothetical protein
MIQLQHKLFFSQSTDSWWLCHCGNCTEVGARSTFGDFNLRWWWKNAMSQWVRGFSTCSDKAKEITSKWQWSSIHSSSTSHQSSIDPIHSIDPTGWCLGAFISHQKLHPHPACILHILRRQMMISKPWAWVQRSFREGLVRLGIWKEDGFENCYLKKVISSIATATYSDDC